MAKPPAHASYLATADALQGFSAIAHHFWRTAEKLRHQAVQTTTGQTRQTCWTVHSAICLYHAALECFCNEENAFRRALTAAPSNDKGYKLQGATLSAEKLDDLFAYFGISDKHDPDIQRRTILLIGLRNRLFHHWPEMRDVRDYPVTVIDALTDAKIDNVNTSWTAQCSDIRLAKWAADIVRAFIDQWWQIARSPSQVDRVDWEYGPDYVYPAAQTTDGNTSSQQNTQK
jgi:hypothetical protein